MNKLIPVLFLFFTLNSFSQENNSMLDKLRGIGDLVQSQQYELVISESEEVLSGKYGKVENNFKIYFYFYIADSYKNLRNYSQSIEKYNEIIEFISKSDITGIGIVQKEESYKNINKIIGELQLKISQNGNTTTNSKTSNSNKINQSSKTTNPNKINNNSNVTLVTVSSGKSPSEAIKLALRDALEQTFGTFISSNSEILNDELVKDEIVSVSSGNIVDYEVLSESELSNGYYSVSVRSTVSLTSFASYMQNKGHEVSFSGKSFGMKIKLQKLNEQSEEKAIDNMILVLRDIIKKSVDFEIANISEPVFKEDWSEAEGKELYNVIINVKPIINENYDSFKKFFLETLRSIAMSDSEVEEYSRVKKKVYTFIAFDEEHFSYPNELKKFELIDAEKFRKDIKKYVKDYGFQKFSYDSSSDLVKQNIDHYKNIASYNYKLASNGTSRSKAPYFNFKGTFNIASIGNHSKIYIGENILDTYIFDRIKKTHPLDTRWEIEYSGLGYTIGLDPQANARIDLKSFTRHYSRIDFLRNHDDLKLRSKESMYKIDWFLQSNQFHIFNFALKYGNDEWSPLFKKTNPDQIKYYRLPAVGLPSAYDQWNEADRTNYASRSNSYEKVKSKAFCGTCKDYFKNPDSSVIGYYGEQLIFTDILPWLPTSNQPMNDLFYHTVSLKLTLSELENIEDFELINRNILD